MIREMLIFVGGAACGFAAATLLLRDRYKTMVDEEVASVMEWANKKSTEKKTERKKAEDLRKPYVSEDPENDHGLTEKPYQISAEEFEETDEGYDKMSLDYYLEGETLYNGEERVIDIDGTVGADNLVRLHGDLDVVYVRDENSKIDYEIVGVNGRFGVY